MNSSEEKIRESLSLDTLIEWYRREILSDDYLPADRAVLLYQIGKLEEIINRDHAEAARHYLLSFKQDSSFALSIIAAGSMLFSTGSFERLQRLYETALDSIEDPAVKSAVLMFLVESIEGQGRTEGVGDYLLGLEAAGRYPVHALVMQEWEHLLARNGEAAAGALEKLKVTTENPHVRAHLCLEMARASEKSCNRELAMELLREAAHNGRDFFPVMPEILRMGTQGKEMAWLEQVILDDMNALLQGGDPASRFILAGPSSGLEACVLFAGMLSTLARTSGAPISDEAREAIFGIVRPALQIDRRPGSLSLLLDLAKSGAAREALTEVMELLAEETQEPIEKVWLQWNLVKIDLQDGRTDRALERIRGIAAGGFSSEILDSLVSLFNLNLGRQDEMLACIERLSGEGGRDIVADAIHSDLMWSYKNDLAGVAEKLSGYEKFTYGMEDIAYIAAEAARNNFLKEKVLAFKADAEASENFIAKVEMLKLHAFEQPNPEKFLAAAEAFSPSSRSLALWASMAGLWKSFETGNQGREAHFLRSIAANVSAGTFSPFAFKKWTENILGVKVLDEEKIELPQEADLKSPLGHHALLLAASDPVQAGEVAAWIKDALERDDAGGFSPGFLLHAARRAQEACPPGSARWDLRDALTSSKIIEERFPGYCLYLALKEGNPPLVLEALWKASSRMDQSQYDQEEAVACNIMAALRAMFIEGDFAGAARHLEKNRTEGRIDPESMFMLLVTLPLAGRWKEWIDLWSTRDRRGGVTEGAYEADLERACMTARLALARDMGGAVESARGILSLRKGDPASTIVNLYSALKKKDREEFSRHLKLMGTWLADSPARGKLSFHLDLLDSLAGKGIGPKGEGMIVPDLLNMNDDVAYAAHEGFINLTDKVVESSFAGLGKLKGTPPGVAGLVEFGEFLESGARPRQALSAYEEALNADRHEIGAILGILRIASGLEAHASAGRALESYGEMTADPRRAAGRFVEAAESYLKGQMDAEVARCFEKAFEKDPSNDKCFHGLVAAMEKKKEIAPLIALIERRVGTISEYGELQTLLLKLANLKRQARDMEGAVIAVEDLLLITPEDAPEKITALRLKMDLLIQMGKFEEAIRIGSRVSSEADDQKVRRGVLQKCINLAFQKLNKPELGLNLCKRLIEEGETNPEFVNKTLGIALKLGRWDEAASIQDRLAEVSPSPKERISALLKKAEIFLRYAKDPARAEDTYKAMLREDPGRWEALTRWQAARGARQLTEEELREFIDAALQAVDLDPLNIDALSTIVRANKILMNTQAARYYEGLLGILSGKGGVKVPAPPGVRPSMPLAGKPPSGRISPHDMENLAGIDDVAQVINEAVRKMSRKDVIELLQREKVIPRGPRVNPEEGVTPILRYVQGWGSAFGMDSIQVVRSALDDDDVHVHPDIPDGIMLGARTIVPLSPETSFRLGYYLFNICLGTGLLNLVGKESVIGIVSSAVKLFSSFDMQLEKKEDFTDMLSEGIDAASRSSILMSLGTFRPLEKTDIIRWYHKMSMGAMQAGCLAAGKIDGMVRYFRPDMSSLEEKTREDIKALFEKEALMKDLLRFILSPRYLDLRQMVGLD